MKHPHTSQGKKPREGGRGWWWAGTGLKPVLHSKSSRNLNPGINSERHAAARAGGACQEERVRCLFTRGHITRASFIPHDNTVSKILLKTHGVLDPLSVLLFFFLHNRIKTRCARKRSSPHAAAFPGERDGADGLVDRKGVTLRPVSRDAVIRSHRSAPVLNTYCRRECTRQRCGTTRMCAKCQQRKVLRACIKCNYLRSFLVEFGWWFPPFLPRGLVNTWQQKQNSPVAWIRPITSVCTAGDKVCSSFM